MATSSPAPVRFLTGITTSGTPHLGNYVGSVRHSVRFSRQAHVQSFYFLADYHALIKVDEPARIQRSTLEIAATWLACGLDPGARHLLPPVRHRRDPRADLVADLRHRQGRAEPRPRLQGADGQERRQRRGPGRRRERRPLHVPGADGRRHPDVQRAQGAGGPRPGPAHRDGARHGAALQPPLRRALHAARGRDRRRGGHAARPRRPQDEQELRQHDPALHAARPAAEADRRHRDRLARARRAQGHRRLGAVPDLPGLRRRRGDRGAAQGLRRRHRLGRRQADPVRAHRPRGRADARALRRPAGRPGADREDPAGRRRQGARDLPPLHGRAAPRRRPAQPGGREPGHGAQGGQGRAPELQAIPRERRAFLFQAARRERRTTDTKSGFRVAAGGGPGHRHAARAARRRTDPDRRAARTHRQCGHACGNGRVGGACREAASEKN